MGYTHYLYTDRSFTDTEWLRLGALVEQIMTEAYADHGVYFTGPCGTRGTEPMFERDYIAFNAEAGQGYESVNIDREFRTFAGRDYGFTCCKTRLNLYDASVVATYLAVKHILGDAARVLSDGEGEGGWDLKGREILDRARAALGGTA